MLKGKACMNCRRRKIKCDGDRPSCGQCAKSNGTFEDCEYPGPGPTQVQLLEERISHVQDRIRQLETGADLSSPSLSGYSGTSSPHEIFYGSPRTPPRASPSCSGSPRSASSNGLSSPHSDLSHSSQCVEPSQEVIVVLFDAFCRFSHLLGFFLDLDRFQESIFLSAAPGHYARPCPSLLYAIYLWGTHFTPSSQSFRFSEDVFLEKSLHHLPSDLASSHPSKVLHVLQAEVLLSYYHLRKGKALGGNYHANAAVSLFLSSGLHRVFSPGWLSTETDTLYLSSGPEAESSIAAGMTKREYCDILCSILSLNAYWVTLQESHTMLYDMQDVGVNTPGIMDRQLRKLHNISSQNTANLFTDTHIQRVSFRSLLGGASLLLEDATHLPSVLPGTTQPTFGGYGQPPATTPADVFVGLDTLIDQYKTYFPLLHQRISTRAEQELFLVIQLIVETATIKLHSARASQGDLQSRSKSLFCAHAIALLMENATRDAISGQTMVGLFCSAACEVLARELAMSDSVMENKAQWRGVLTSLYSRMVSCSGSNLFMSFLVKRLAKNHPEILSFDSTNQ